MNDQIFVQIAAYRDPQLVPTVLDCIAKAKHPKRLVFCICWQHDETERIDELKDVPNLRIIDVPHRKSQGACWARNQIQRHWNNETYTLQIDSHHRFQENWDELVIDMFQRLVAMGHRKPILTCYPPSFDPENDPAGRNQTPWQVNFNNFNDDGVLGMVPTELENWKSLSVPVPTRFYSAGFCFTWGIFCREVPHDPFYYFMGEEINITVRAFTRGYDLFHPHKIVLWHYYTRKGSKRHWDDHKAENKEAIAEKRSWDERNRISVYRNKCFFQQDNHAYGEIDWGPYSMGTERSLRMYELYAGIHFASRRIQKYTLERKPAPNPFWNAKTEPEWFATLLKLHSHSIDVQVSHFKHDDYTFMCVAFEREDNSLINRTDLPGAELLKLIAEAKANNTTVKIQSKFHAGEHPHHCVIWPYSKDKGWVERLSALVPQNTTVIQTVAPSVMIEPTSCSSMCPPSNAISSEQDLIASPATEHGEPERNAAS